MGHHFLLQFWYVDGDSKWNKTKKKILKISQVVFELQFGPSQGQRWRFSFAVLWVTWRLEKWLKCQFYHFGGCRIQKKH